jgi:protein-tyrosine kinase
MNNDQDNSEEDGIRFDLETRQGALASSAAFSTPLASDYQPDFDEAPPRHMPTQHGEQMRKLRTEILVRHGYNNASPLAFAIVSPCAGDGRSLLAGELAISFAQLGRATLLIDADMRSAKRSVASGRRKQIGLAQALETGATPDLNRVAGYMNLSVLDAGDSPSFNPTDLLWSKRFYSIVDSLRNLYSFVIVDTPPFMPHSDAMVISTIVGRALTVHRAPHNSYADTRLMLDGLSRAGAEVMGGVLNRFS